MKSKIKLAVFDLAGTVVDHGSCAPAGAFVRLFEIHGIEAGIKQAREPMGMHKRDHIKTMLNMPEIAEQWKAAKGAKHNETDIELLFRQFIPMQLECLPDFCGIIKGAAETAAKLRRQGIKLGATTGYNREMMDIVLTELNKQGLEFDVTCCASEVAAGRPAPWMIYRCMEAAGVYPVSSVINFGDTVADVSSGRNAGVFSVGVVRSGNMLGLNERETEALEPALLKKLIKDGTDRMKENGADAVFSDINSAEEAIALAESRYE